MVRMELRQQKASDLLSGARTCREHCLRDNNWTTTHETNLTISVYKDHCGSIHDIQSVRNGEVLVAYFVRNAR